MAYSANTNNKKSKYATIRKFYARNKWLVFTVMVFILMGILYLNLSVDRSDRDNVILMREHADTLIDKIKDSEQPSVWKNESSCMISRARTFDEKTTYSCDVRYTHVRAIASQQDIDRLIEDINSSLTSSVNIVSDLKDESSGSVLLSDETGVNSYYAATSFLLKSVRLDRGPCYVRYVMSPEKESLKVYLECVVKTKKAYFEPIHYI